MDDRELQTLTSICGEALSGVARVQVLAADVFYFVKVIEAAQAGAEFLLHHGPALAAARAVLHEAEQAAAHAMTTCDQAEAQAAEAQQRLAQEAAEAVSAHEALMTSMAKEHAQLQLDIRAVTKEREAQRRADIEAQRLREHAAAAHEQKLEGLENEGNEIRQRIQQLIQQEKRMLDERRQALQHQENLASSTIYRRRSSPHGR